MSSDDYQMAGGATAAGRTGMMALAPQFLEVAACPACHAKLAVDYEAGALVCTSPACGLAYPVRDGIPILLIDEARRPGGSEVEPDDSAMA